MSASGGSATPRRHDLDWLRIAAVALLVPFHTARVFNVEEDFYVKNAPRDEVSQRFIDLVGPWHMSLLFCVAGAATWLAFRHRSARRYAGERVRRLLVPFVFGLLVVVPPQTWLAYNTHHDGADLSYPEYLPRFFTTADADLTGYAGGFTPGHLWFIATLLVISVVALPALLWLHHGRGRAVLAAVGGVLGHPLALVALPVAALVAPWYVMGDDLSGQPVIGFPLLFVLGFLVLADPRAGRAIDRHWPWILALGAGASVVYAEVEPRAGGWPLPLLKGLYETGVWCVILGLLGVAHRWLSRGGRAWAYATEAAYPFYVLHQTAIVAVAVPVVQWDIPAGGRFAVIAVVSAAVSLAVYELAVRRWGPVRFLFGMRPRQARPNSARAASMVSNA